MAEAPDDINCQRGAVAIPSQIPYSVLGNGVHQIAALPHKPARHQLCLCTALAAEACVPVGRRAHPTGVCGRP